MCASQRKATLFVISAPSGAGKTSLVKALTADDQGLLVSISHTTRTKRDSEVDGKDYHFIDEAAFLGMLGQDAFLEQACVFDNHYGTSKAWVEGTLAKGVDVILEIDWQGAQQVAGRIDCVMIFIIPPSIEVLQQRLKNRSEDSDDIIRRRMEKAKDEISHFDASDYLVVNDEFDKALLSLKSIVSAERCRTNIQKAGQQTLIENLLK